MIIAQEKFQEREFFESKRVLEQSKARITIASNTKILALGSNGDSIKPNISFDLINVEDYDALVMIGGFGAKEFLWNDLTLRKAAKDAWKKGIVIGAICLAPVILARAGLLAGQKATVHRNKETLNEFNLHGVRYFPEEVVVHDNIVTGKGPKASRKFGLEILKLLDKKA